MAVAVVQGLYISARALSRSNVADLSLSVGSVLEAEQSGDISQLCICHWQTSAGFLSCAKY